MATTSAKPPLTNRGVTEKAGCAFSVGIDWLTVTVANDKRGFDLYDIARNYWISLGVKSRDWRNKWYTGRTGEGVTWGTGKNGYILMASGQAAPKVWKKCLLVKTRVTRIDLQVTAKLQKPQPGLIETCYHYIRENRRFTKRRKYGLIQNTKQGVTLYAGSRQSQQYGRFYDKGIESNLEQPGTLYRYEVELKKPLSGSLADYLITSLQDGIYPEKELVWYVYNWWLDRGVLPIFNPNRAATIEVTGMKVQTDNERKIQWLRTQVAPTISRLEQDGRLEDALEALGLKI